MCVYTPPSGSLPTRIFPPLRRSSAWVGSLLQWQRCSTGAEVRRPTLRHHLSPTRDASSIATEGNIDLFAGRVTPSTHTERSCPPRGTDVHHRRATYTSCPTARVASSLRSSPSPPPPPPFPLCAPGSAFSAHAAWLDQYARPLARSSSFCGANPSKSALRPRRRSKSIIDRGWDPARSVLQEGASNQLVSSRSRFLGTEWYLQMEIVSFMAACTAAAWSGMAVKV